MTIDRFALIEYSKRDFALAVLIPGSWAQQQVQDLRLQHLDKELFTKRVIEIYIENCIHSEELARMEVAEFIDAYITQREARMYMLIQQQNQSIRSTTLAILSDKLKNASADEAVSIYKSLCEDYVAATNYLKATEQNLTEKTIAFHNICNDVDKQYTEVFYSVIDILGLSEETKKKVIENFESSPSTEKIVEVTQEHHSAESMNVSAAISSFVGTNLLKNKDAIGNFLDALCGKRELSRKQEEAKGSYADKTQAKFVYSEAKAESYTLVEAIASAKDKLIEYGIDPENAKNHTIDKSFKQSY